MKHSYFTFIAIFGVLVLIGGFTFGAGGVETHSSPSSVVYESNTSVSENLTVYTRFFANVSMKSDLQYTGNETRQVDTKIVVEGVEIENTSWNLKPESKERYQLPIQEYTDPTSDHQNILFTVEDRAISYQYDTSDKDPDPESMLLPEISSLSVFETENSVFLNMSILYHSPHSFSQEVYVHTEQSEVGSSLDGNRSNDTSTPEIPRENVSIKLEENPTDTISGTVWHYYGSLLHEDNGLSKVEFTETEHGELEVEHVEYTEIDLDTDNVHRTPSDAERAQERAQSAADRWLVNTYAPAVLFAGIALVVAYVVARRRS